MQPRPLFGEPELCADWYVGRKAPMPVAPRTVFTIGKSVIDKSRNNPLPPRIQRVAVDVNLVPEQLQYPIAEHIVDAMRALLETDPDLIPEAASARKKIYDPSKPEEVQFAVFSEELQIRLGIIAISEQDQAAA